MNKIYKFKTYQNKKISINFIKLIKNIDAPFFLKTYKISNIFFGKFFMKRLINKVFKYQLNHRYKWIDDFWRKVKIQLIDTQIILDSDLSIISRNYQKYSNKKRLKDINKYRLLLNKNYDLGSPLFISGSCINYLGGNVKNNDIFMLDGSRRLYAYILNESNPHILFIDLKSNCNE